MSAAPKINLPGPMGGGGGGAGGGGGGGGGGVNKPGAMKPFQSGEWMCPCPCM